MEARICMICGLLLMEDTFCICDNCNEDDEEDEEDENKNVSSSRKNGRKILYM